MSESPLRARILDATAGLTIGGGWAAVSMGKIASAVGVSRQTVHTEVGTKAELAEALVIREVEGFLAEVIAGFDGAPDVPTAIESSITRVLRRAEDSALVRGVVTAAHGADTELLPLLTTRPEHLLELATATVQGLVAPFALPLPQARIDATIEVIVRVALSQVMHPTGTPEQAGEHLAWMVRVVLDAIPDER
ncbi:TetR family transcriptional regulator [Janibacter indicus]|uniref:TetR family transcriptional regulator n=1 Tax=Janibacter indicus TaxID=857417 RepID=A0A7L9J388_9MICO|nr:TetR family transcriptional regulator [Janibacter indicus]QOK23769.1 TetR family transcriptional regulator [Janibacter indicus]